MDRIGRLRREALPEIIMVLVLLTLLGGCGGGSPPEVKIFQSETKAVKITHTDCGDICTSGGSVTWKWQRKQNETTWVDVDESNVSPHTGTESVTGNWQICRDFTFHFRGLYRIMAECTGTDDWNTCGTVTVYWKGVSCQNDHYWSWPQMAGPFGATCDTKLGSKNVEDCATYAPTITTLNTSLASPASPPPPPIRVWVFMTDGGYDNNGDFGGLQADTGWYNSGTMGNGLHADFAIFAACLSAKQDDRGEVDAMIQKLGAVVWVGFTEAVGAGDAAGCVQKLLDYSDGMNSVGTAIARVKADGSPGSVWMVNVGDDNQKIDTIP
jgi:hypothetical protein